MGTYISWLPRFIASLIIGGVLLVSACSPRSVDAQDASAPTLPQLRKAAENFLVDPAFVTGLGVGAQLGDARDGEVVSFSVLRTSDSPGGREVPFGTISVDRRSGEVAELKLSERTEAPLEVILPFEHCMEVARGLLERKVPRLFVGADEVIGGGATDIRPDGTYGFCFSRMEGGFSVPVWADVKVSAHDASVSGLYSVWKEYQIPTETIPEAKALEIAKRQVRRYTGRSLQVHAVPLKGKQILAPPQSNVKRATPCYWFRLQLADASAGEGQRIPGLQVWVNAITGEIVDAMLAPISPETLSGRTASSATTVTMEDRFPCWFPDVKSLVFQSRRSVNGVPAYKALYTGLYIADADGRELRVVAPGSRRGLLHPDVSDRCLVVFESSCLGTIDLRTGAVEQLTQEGRPGQWPRWSRDGRRVVVSAIRRYGDLDLFIIDASGTHGETRLLRLDGIEAFPVFASKGDTVFFAYAEGLAMSPMSENWSIRIAVPPRNEVRGETQLVADGFGRIERMTIFPDGRLLVWHEGGLDVVDPETKTKEPLDLPPLRDPELPAARPALKLRDPAVSPDGKLLAFSGYRDSGDPEHGTGWYIYTCNLDGSDVKRITPLEDDPVEPYVFPETGKTAFDVAKEIAEQQQQQEGE